MLKKRIGIIALILIITIALALPVVRAVDETANVTAENQTATENTTTENTATVEGTTTEDAATEENATMTEENFKQHDVYLTGDDITIDYVVDGNLFVMANNVTINSQIGGDAFIFANTVTVGEQGYIFSNLFTVATTVNVQGVVYDLYSLADTTNITGYVYRDIKVSSNNLNIFGTIGRNAFVNSNNIAFSQTADVTEESTTVATQGMINGNFEYTAKNEMTIPDGVVTGEVKYTQANTGNNNGIQSYLISLGTILATVILVWLVSLWLTPKFAKNTDLINKKSILPQIGLGILTPIVLVIVSIILVLIGITAPFGLLVLGLTFLLIAISTSVFIIAINNMICNKLKIQKTIGILGMLIVTAAVLWLIGLIPYVGGIVGIIAMIIGLGIIVYSLVKKDKKQEEKQQEVK